MQVGRFVLVRWHLTISQQLTSRRDKSTDAPSYLPQWYILGPTSRENVHIRQKLPRQLAVCYNHVPRIPTLEILCPPALPIHLL